MLKLVKKLYACSTCDSLMSLFTLKFTHSLLIFMKFASELAYIDPKYPVSGGKDTSGHSLENSEQFNN